MWTAFILLFGIFMMFTVVQRDGIAFSIATGYGLDGPGCSQHGKIFLLSTEPKQAQGPTQPPVQWVPGTISKWVKQPGREADHSLPSSRGQEWWSYTSTPQCLQDSA
jgi:hypothetical protein